MHRKNTRVKDFRVSAKVLEVKCPVEQPGSKQRVVLSSLFVRFPLIGIRTQTPPLLSLICILFSLANLFKQLSCADFDRFIYTSIQSQLLFSMDLWNHKPFVRSNLSPMRYVAACLKRHRSAVLSAGSVFTLFWLQLHAMLNHTQISYFVIHVNSIALT